MIMKKATLLLLLLLSFAGVQAQILSCTDLNGYVSSKNTGGTGSYTLQIGQEEKAAQTYHYNGPGKVNNVRVYGNYPGLAAGVPLQVGIYNIDANGRPTTLLQSTNATWWWFNNTAGYITVSFGGGGVYVSSDFAVTVEVRNASPWGSSFMLQYTGNGEGLGEDLASLAGTSTGNNWSSAMATFNKDGDFYLVPNMTHFITPDFTVSAACNAINAPVSFTNNSLMTTDSMFNTIGLNGYSGTNFFYTWDFGDMSPVTHTTNASHSYNTAGSYTVTLTCTIDGWGGDCSYSTTQVISVGLGVSASATAATCNGSADGTITLTASGGAPAYTYQLNNDPVQSSGVFSGLTAGTYSATVTDNLGCTSVTTVTVTQPPAIVITSVSSTNSSCGSSNGGLLVSASGGTGALQYQINSGPFQSGGQFNNLPSGFYTINVKDANGCMVTNYGAVNDQGGPTLLVVSTTNVSCNGGSNGTIVLNGTGGSGTLQYSINGGNTWQTSGSFLNLAAGVYLCMVKDASGCSSSLKISLSEPPAISFQVTFTSVSCNGGSDGTITVLNGTGGTGTYSYGLNNQNYQSSNIFSSVAAGTYTVYLRDIAGCFATEIVTVTEPAAIAATTSATGANCNGSFDGSVSVTASGGTAPYIYSIDGENFQSSSVFSELESGTYTITIEDAGGCQLTVTTVVTQPAPVTASITTGASTCGNANGTMLVIGSGGSGSGYQYSIDGINFNSTGSFTGLVSGAYGVVVTDGAGCRYVTGTYIYDANGPVITSVSHTNVGCNGGADGTITVNIVTGGTGTLMYSLGTSWQSSNVFTGLSAGTYYVLVRDVNGCVGQISVTLTEPNPIVVTTTATDASCYGDNSGSVLVIAAGGSGTLAYKLDQVTNYQSSNIFNNLGAGTYDAVVRDAAGCTGHDVFVISQPHPILVSASTLNIMCHGDNNGAIYAYATGGTGSIMYSLDNITYQSGGSFTNLVAGSYTVYAKDANGCIQTRSVILTEPPALVINNSVSNVVCSGGNDGAIDLSISGGTIPYFFNWSTGETTEDIFNLAAGSYSVTVTDANGCTSSLSLVITQSTNVLSVNGVIIDATSATSADGGVNLTATGGTGPYSYLWSNGQTGQNLSGVNPGVYSVIVTDANGCVTSNIFLVGNLSGIAAAPVDPATVLMYPNPASLYFTIEAGRIIERVDIADMLGQVVYSEAPETAKSEINTDQFTAGTYFVSVYINGTRTVKRIQVIK